MTYFTKNQEYLRSDKIHFNTAGLIKIADDCCRNIVNYLGLGSDASLGGTDPVTYLPDPNKVLGIYFKETEITVGIGTKTALNCLFTVDNGIFGIQNGDIFEPVCNQYTLSSSDPGTVAAEGNTITPLKEGTAVITAVYIANPELTADITERVKAD